MRIVIEDLFKCFLLMLAIGISVSLVAETNLFMGVVLLLAALTYDYYIWKNKNFKSNISIVTIIVLALMSLNHLIYLFLILLNIIYICWLKKELKEKVDYIYLVSHSIKFLSFLFYLIVFSGYISYIQSEKIEILHSLAYSIIVIIIMLIILIVLLRKISINYNIEIAKVKKEIINLNFTLVAILTFIAFMTYISGSM